MIQVRPDEFEMTSVRTRASTPNPSAMRKASLTATVATPAIRLLQSLATSPAPTAPMWTTWPPMAPRTGRAASRSSASPPTMMASVPSSAPATPPETGASMNRTPRSRSRAATRREVSGIDRRHVDAEPPRGDALEHALGPEVDGLDVRRRGQHGDDEVTLGGHRGRGAAAARPEPYRRLQRRRLLVVGHDREPLGHEVPQHGPAHAPGPDEPDRHRSGPPRLWRLSRLLRGDAAPAPAASWPE